MQHCINRILFFTLSAILIAVPHSVSAAQRTLTKAEAALVGSYRCRSYNVSGGGGGNCRLMPPIILKKDGTYSISSERGTFKVKKRKLMLSAGKIRGKGSLSADNKAMSFTYLYRGWKHVIVYAHEGKAILIEKPISPVVSSVPLELTINFPASDGSVAWINVISLVPQGHTLNSAPYRAESLAIQEGRSNTVYASYSGAKEIPTGAVYDVYASSGIDSQKIGTIDLLEPKGPVKSIMNVLSAGSPQAAAPVATPETPASVMPSSPPSERTAAPQSCNPGLPHYAGGC